VRNRRHHRPRAPGPQGRADAFSSDAYSDPRALDREQLRQAVRASASLPRLGGEPPVFRVERMADGGLIEPIPFQTALRDGATHVLVLRSRPPGYRWPALSTLGESLALRDNPGLVELIRVRNGVYNRQALELQFGPGHQRGTAHVQQIAVRDHTRLVGRLENNGERIAEALRAGAREIAPAVLTEPIDLCWQPAVCRTAPGQDPADQRGDSRE
jgi:predicted patatin/cPLA2 family phospholipase